MPTNSTHRHFIFHKPYNCLSQFIYNGKRKSRKRLIGQFYNFPEGTMAIGRLDENSEGLLLMTTDGKVSEEIRSSKYEKEYWVQLDGMITDEAIELLKIGVEIGFGGMKYITKPCKASKITTPESPHILPRKIRHERHGPTSWASIIIREGKYRQIRKMTAAVGFPTLRLIRVRIGDIYLSINESEVVEVENFNCSN